MNTSTVRGSRSGLSPSTGAWRRWTGLTALIGAVSCGGAETSPTPPAPLVIAVLTTAEEPSSEGPPPDLVWASEAVDAAGGVAGRQLSLERVEVDPDELSTQAQALARDDRYVAVIGPQGSEGLALAADAFVEARKPLVSYTSTAADLLRAYGGEGPIWRTRQSDIAQTELLVRLALEGGAARIALLTTVDTTGYTFFSWFGFFAREYGIADEAVAVVKLGDPATCGTAVQEALASNPDLLLVAASAPEQQACVIGHLPPPGAARPRVIVADTGLDPNRLTELGAAADGVEGLASAGDADYTQAFLARFGADATVAPHGPNGYDAVLLLAYGLQVSGGQGGEALIEALKEVVDGREGPPMGWDPIGVEATLAALARGERPSLGGASGPLQFEPGFYMDLQASTLARWTLEAGALTYRERYFTGDPTFLSSQDVWVPGSTGEASTPAGSDWTPATPRAEVWALIAAFSSGWSNYRHQADALRQYQILRARGVPDDHIVLALADDLAENTLNTAPGTVRNQPGGEDLHHDLEIDYGLDLTGDALVDILTGSPTEAAPTVMALTPSSNLLVYLVGHGGAEGMPIGALTVDDGLDGNGALFTPDHLRDALCTLQGEGRLRRALIMVESCFSGVFGEGPSGGLTAGCDGEGGATPLAGTILITAASSLEASYSGEYDAELGAWVNDEFSRELALRAEADPTTDLLDFYVSVYKDTPGSHPTLFTTSVSGDLSALPLTEFILP